MIRVLQSLPAWAAYGIADLLVPVLVCTTVLTRRRADRKKRGFYRNTTIVFRGDIDTGSRRRLLWRWARHMTHMAVDTCRMPAVDAGNVGKYCDVTALSEIQRVHARGRGLIGATGHVGAYEFSSYLIALHGTPTITIYRESPIPIITDIINELRSGSSGQVMVERTGAVREMLRAARRGDVMGVVADVSSKESEVFAPFLGTLAATNNTAGILHLKTGAPIQVITTQRTARQRYKLCVWDTIEVPPGDDRERDLQRIADRINAALTRAITEYPEQWFWDCRRFRSRPAGEVRDTDDLPPRIDAAPAAAILRRLRSA